MGTIKSAFSIGLMKFLPENICFRKRNIGIVELEVGQFGNGNEVC